MTIDATFWVAISFFIFFADFNLFKSTTKNKQSL